MEDIGATKTKIGSLLSHENFFHVAGYQRPFSWDTDNFEDLINDLIGANKDQEYFLGTIVLHQQGEKGHYHIVDGQQRLTSILILFACLRDLVEDQKFKQDLQLKILQQANVVDKIPQRIRLEVRERELFQEVIVAEGGTKHDKNETDMPEPEWRYLNAINVFNSKLSDLKEEQLKELIQFLSLKCVVIKLATESFDDAFRLFTIVNDRGKQLRRIDILKAINIAPDAIASDTIRDRVAQDWEHIAKDLGEERFENVFHLVRLVLLKDKPQGDLLKEFESRIFARKLVSKGEPFFNLIFKYTKLYNAIFEDKDIIPSETNVYNRFYALIHIMNAEFKASEWRACLMYYAYKFNDRLFYEFCLKMEKVYLAQWVAAIRKDERYSDYSKILASIESAKTPGAVITAIDYDEDAIMKAVTRKDFYHVGFARYFLLRLELLTAEHDRPHEFKAKSVEHVLPISPEKEGYWADHHNLDQIEEYVNTIGNLVLLSKSKNSAAKNYDFGKKKEKYLEKRVSDYPRSVKVLEYDGWDRETIDKRTKEAQKLILKDP